MIPDIPMARSLAGFYWWTAITGSLPIPSSIAGLLSSSSLRPSPSPFRTLDNLPSFIFPTSAPASVRNPQARRPVAAPDRGAADPAGKQAAHAGRLLIPAVVVPRDVPTVVLLGGPGPSVRRPAQTAPGATFLKIPLDAQSSTSVMLDTR